jgi:phosphatidylcholine synthase
VHPLRVARWRRVSVVLVLAWSALALAAVLADLEPGIFVKLSLVALAVYFCTVGLWRGPVLAASP